MAGGLTGWLRRRQPILDDISDLRMWLTEESDLRGVLDRLQRDVVPLEMMKIVFDPPDGVDVSELQKRAIQVLGFLVRETPPLLFGTCDRLRGRLQRASVDATAVVTVLRDRRAAIFAEREIIRVRPETL